MTASAHRVVPYPLRALVVRRFVVVAKARLVSGILTPESDGGTLRRRHPALTACRAARGVPAVFTVLNDGGDDVTAGLLHRVGRRFHVYQRQGDADSVTAAAEAAGVPFSVIESTSSDAVTASIATSLVEALPSLAPTSGITGREEAGLAGLAGYGFRSRDQTWRPLLSGRSKCPVP